MKTPRQPMCFKLILCLFSCTVFFSCDKGDPALNELDHEILKRGEYIAAKNQRIKRLTEDIYANLDKMDDLARYESYDKLYDEYMSYRFDSAFKYSAKLLETGRRIDADHMVDGLTKYGFILANGGLYKESLDTLFSLDIDSYRLSQKVEVDYYIALGRIYHNLGDFVQNNAFSPHYNRLGNGYLQKGAELSDDPITVNWLLGKQEIKNGNLGPALTYYSNAAELLAQKDSVSTIILSTLGRIYFRMGDHDESLKYYTLCAINNIRESRTESVSLFEIATMLFYHRGDVYRAAEYINVALDDANIYSSRNRKLVIGGHLPIIVAEKLDIIQQKNRTLSQYIIIISVLAVALILLSSITIRQMFKLSRQKLMLEELNGGLSEANLIKEEYIGHYVRKTTEVVNHIDKFVKVAGRKLQFKEYADLKKLIADLQTNHNKNTIYEDFDKTFLKIFPSFVEDFNSLMPENEQVAVPEGSLNPTLRIFALVRLGITSSEDISSIIDYSLNTVYNYRTRTRNKSLVGGEQFEEHVKKIGL